MNNHSRAAGTLLYVTAGVCIALYEAFCILILSPVYKVITLLFACAAVYSGSLLHLKNGADTYKTMKITFAIIFTLYILLLCDLLFFDSYFGRSGFSSAEGAEIGMRLTPFSTIKDFLRSIKTGGHSPQKIATNLLGNLVAFMPFSLFLPMLIRLFRKAIPFLIATAGIIITAELTQFIFKTGVCDIDDLILNLTGAALAFGILKIKPIKRLILKLTKLEY